MRAVVVLPEGAPSTLRATIEEALRATGHEPLAPAPDAMAGIAQSERNRFLTLVDRMLEAELLVVDASSDSATVGWCVGWFLSKGRLVVLACPRKRRSELSAMLAGNPSPWQRLVLYDEAADLRQNLVATLRLED